MFQILKYVLIGLILMVPQELTVNIFKGFIPVNFLLALVFWAVLLMIMYEISKVTKKIIKSKGLELTLSMLLYAFVGLFIEWVVIGNSPTGNPDANQFGLVAGWVSVFVLPRMFLEDGYERVKKWTKIWYLPFVAAMLLPILFIPETGPVIGVTIYGYVVIPFLIFSLWCLVLKWKE